VTLPPPTGDDYEKLVGRVQAAVRSHLPAQATVLVASKGDEALRELDGRRAWHFPRSEDGGYAGYHPTSSEEAIAQLEMLRAQGADYLLLPATSFWWLEHFPELRQHLDGRYGRVLDDEDCVIFGLT
jgi:hypothetical protein